MRTFHKIVQLRKSQMVTDPDTEEGKWILQSLVSVTLNYRINGPTLMYYHSMKGAA